MPVHMFRYKGLILNLGIDNPATAAQQGQSKVLDSSRISPTEGYPKPFLASRWDRWRLWRKLNALATAWICVQCGEGRLCKHIIIYHHWIITFLLGNAKKGPIAFRRKRPPQQHLPCGPVRPQKGTSQKSALQEGLDRDVWTQPSSQFLRSKTR